MNIYKIQTKGVSSKNWQTVQTSTNEANAKIIKSQIKNEATRIKKVVL